LTDNQQSVLVNYADKIFKISFMKLRSIYALFVFLLINLTMINAQVTVSGCTAAGNGNYTSLSAAAAAIIAAQPLANIVITITGNTTEPVGGASFAAGSWNSLIIQPSGGARTISGAITAGNPLINFNGSDRITINGLNSGGNSLTISNTTVSTTAGTSTIRFIGDANNNTITNCTILGSTTANVAVSAANILFSTGSITGNDNNTISNNNIGDATGIPTMLITSSGTSATISNDSNLISGNNIYNWYSTTAANAINIIANSAAWTINNNKFYQTVSRSGLTSGNYLKCINILTATSGGYTISNNTIGYSSSAATGMFTNNGGRFTGIDIKVAASPLSNIQGNIMNNINWSTASGATSPGGSSFNGIIVNAGGVNIGTTAGNTIGASTGIGSASSGIFITLTTAAATCGILPIYLNSATNCSIQNNNIGAIATAGAATMGYTFSGIYIEGAANHVVTSNNIGNTTSGSIAIGSTGTTTAVCNLYGIYSTSSGAINIGSSGAGNFIQNLNYNSSGTGVFYGIYSSGVISTTANINYNTFTNIAFTAASTATSGGLIYIDGSSPTAVMNINNNVFNGNAFNFTGTTGGSGSLYCIRNVNPWATININNNTFNNLSVKSSGNFWFCNNNSTTKNTNFNNNRINTGFTKTLAGGTVILYYNIGAPTTNGTATISGNNFSNITLTGATTFNGIQQNTNNNQTVLITNDTISNITGGSSTLNGFYMGSGAAGSSVNGNIISNFNSSSAINGINLGNTTAPVSLNVFGNTVNTLYSTAAATVIGITEASGTAVNIYKNKIYDLQANNLAGSVQGIAIIGGTTSSIHNIYNNIIGDLKTPLTSNADAIRGISITSLSATSTVNLYYNTIFLNATSTGTDFGSSGVFHTANATATTAKLDMRNNIIVNNSIPKGTGFTVAYRRSASALGNYASTSNNNLLYAGTPGAKNIIHYDGSASYQTLANFKTLVAPRDSASITENPVWSSIAGSNASYLHINPGIATLIESHAANVSGYTNDYDGEIRQGNTGYAGSGTAPDIGADEFELILSCSGTPVSSVINGINILCAGSATTLSLSNTYNYSGITYQWSSSSFSGGPYTNSGTSATLATGNLASTTYYKCTITCTNSSLSYTTLIDTVIVAPVSVGGTATANASSVCSGTGTTIVLTGYTGNIQWQSSLNGSNWNNISGGTTASLTTGNLTFATYYRAIVKSGICSADTSTTAIVSIDPATIAGNVTGASTVCAGSNSSILTISGHTGNVMKWQSSPDGIVWTDIINTTTSYTALNLTFSTYYRAVVQSGVCVSANATAALITVIPAVITGSISGATTVCSGINTTLLTLSGNVGNVVKWQSSANGTTWNDISDTTNTYTALNLINTTQYRVMIQTGFCSPANSAAVTITVNPPTIAGTVSGSTNVCTGTNSAFLTLSGQTGNVIKWQSSPDAIIWSDIINTTTSYTATNLTASTQFRAVVQSGNCSPANSSAATITVNPVNIGGILSHDTTVCSTSNTVLLTLNANTGNVSRWESSTDGGLNWIVIPNTVTTYTVNNLALTTKFRVVVQSGVCNPANSSIVTITVNTPPTATILSSINPTSCGNNNGSATVNTAVSYLWSTFPVQTTDTAVGLLAGVYFVTISNGVCTATTSVTLNDPTPPSVTLVSNDSSVCASTIVNFTAGGATNYEFFVNGISQGVPSASNIFSSSTLTNGNIVTVRGKTASCAGNSSAVVMNVSSPSIGGILAGTTTVCSGTNSTTLTLNSYSGSIVNWESSLNGILWTPFVNLNNTFIANNLTATTYYRVVIQNAYCNAVNSSVAIITVLPIPTANISYSASPYCTTASAVSVTQTGTSSGVYSSSTGLSLNASTGTITPATTASGSYTVNYTIAAANGCPAVTATTIVIITSAPTATITYAAGPFCKTVSTLQSVTQTGTSGGKYTALPSGLTIDSISGAIMPNTSTAGNYTITYRIAAAGGCAAMTTTASVTITALPTAGISYPASPFCNSISTAQAVTRIGTAGGKYSALPSGLTIDSITGAITPSTSTAASYTVTYTIAAAGGCSAVTATTAVSITTAPSATINYTGTPFCKTITTAQSVTQTGTNGGTYTATPAGLSINAGTGAITPSMSTAGTYTVTYTIAASGGCLLYTATKTVIITALPSASISYTGTPFCKTLTTAQAVTLIGTSGGTYSAAPSGLSINSSTAAIIPSTSTAGTYTVTDSIAASGGCPVITATTSIVITNPPVATISYAGAPFCKTLTTAQTVTQTGTTAGVYSAAPAGLIFNTSSGAITPSTSTAGTYTVSYTIAAAGGCAAVIATTSVIITNAPAATISYTGTPYCKSITTAQAVTRTGTTGGTYTAAPVGLTINSSTGAITPSSSTAGNYTVTYTIAAAGGCAAVTATALLTITTAPNATITYTGSPYCKSLTTNQAVTRIGTIGGKYTANPLGLSLDSITGSVLPSNSIAGTYMVTYTIAAAGGCATITATDTVIITTPPAATITYAGSPFCTSVTTAQSVTFTGSTGGKYKASPAGLTLDSITGAIIPSVSTAGNYTVTYTIAAAGGCAAVTATATVIITQQPLLNVVSNAPVCEQDSLYLSSSFIAGASYSWTGPDAFTSVLQNPLISSHSNVSMTGIYNLSVTGISGGCPDMTASLNVDVHPKPVANFSYSPFFPETNQDINFTYTGTSASIWNWYINDLLVANVENPVFSIPDFGNSMLILQVQNNFGCMDTIQKQMYIKEVANIWIPNAFSPNGDGMNETYAISTINKLSDFTLKIFNRWGQMVFETNYITEGWDGKYKNEDCPVGTYVVIINYKQIQINHTYEISKTITLIR